MTGEVQVHETSTTMVMAAPAELDAGAGMTLNVRVSCPETCNLQGGRVYIGDADGAVVAEAELITFDETGNETGEFVVKAPATTGEHVWTATFPAQESEGILHGESMATFSFVVKPHATGMAVWDVASPIGFGAKFKARVGVKCSAECKLAGTKIEVYDHEGTKRATATLGDAPWADTAALYWAEVELEAPDTEDVYKWTAKFPQPDLELPHEETAHSFAFRTARPPEHVVTVEVVDRDRKTPIKGAHVVLHPYRGNTDAGGVVRLSVPKGEYELCVFMADYRELQIPARITEDATIKAELIYWPEDQ